MLIMPAASLINNGRTASRCQARRGKGFVCLFLSSGFWLGFFWSAEGGLGLVSHLKSEQQCLGTSMGKRVHLQGRRGRRDGMGDGSPQGGMRGQPHGKGLPLRRCSLPAQGRANVATGCAGLGHPGMVLTPKPPPIASAPQHVPSHGSSHIPRHVVPQPMLGWCSHGREGFPMLQPTWTARMCHAAPRNMGLGRISIPGPFGFFFSPSFCLLSLLLAFSPSRHSWHSQTQQHLGAEERLPAHPSAQDLTH